MSKVGKEMRDTDREGKTVIGKRKRGEAKV